LLREISLFKSIAFPYANLALQTHIIIPHNMPTACITTAPTLGSHAPRILFIGAGSQGHAYAGPIVKQGLGQVVSVCEPLLYKRQDFGHKYIWGLSNRSPLDHEEFDNWVDFVKYETARRERLKAGELLEGNEEFRGVDAVFVCVLDELHVCVVKDLAPLGLHIMCEKPLSTTLDDCTDILRAVTREWDILGRKTIFGIGHVLRYSPHNVMLRKLVREERIVGDVVSVEHTEPIGWWHTTHSFVRLVCVIISCSCIQRLKLMFF